MTFDLTAIALVILVAMFFGMVMNYLRQPPIIGYIIAGFILGPSMLEVIDSRHEIQIIAELGIVMLLFVIGMELPSDGFRKVWQKSCIICACQIALALAITGMLSHLFDWGWQKAVLFGFIAALSSTALIIKMCDSRKQFPEMFMTALVGILIAQDIAFVPMMLTIDNIGDTFDITAALQVTVAIGIVSILLAVLSRHQPLDLPFSMQRNGREVALITGIGFCLASAVVSGLLGLSPAYGAFLAGLVLAHSKKRDVILSAVRPVENLLMMGFFLSIGLLIDLETIAHHWPTVIFFLILILLGKLVMNASILRLLGNSWPRAFALSLALAQIGEFSFLLAQSGLNSQIISSQEYSLVIIIASLSLVTTSFSVPLIEKVRKSPPDSSLRNIYSHLAGSDPVTRKLMEKMTRWANVVRDKIMPK